MTVQNDARNKQNFGIGQIAPVVDKSTNVRGYIDWIHREVHEGDHWFSYSSVTLADVDDAYYVVFKTPGSEGAPPPMRGEIAIAVQATAQAVVKFHENPSVDSDPATLLYNNRRESTNTSELTQTAGTALLGAGTILAQATIGNAVFGGDLKWWNNRARLILNYNKFYCLEIIAKVAGITASWQIDVVDRTEKA